MGRYYREYGIPLSGLGVWVLSPHFMSSSGGGVLGCTLVGFFRCRHANVAPAWSCRWLATLVMADLYSSAGLAFGVLVAGGAVEVLLASFGVTSLVNLLG